MFPSEPSVGTGRWATRQPRSRARCPAGAALFGKVLAKTGALVASPVRFPGRPLLVGGGRREDEAPGATDGLSVGPC